MEKGQQENGDQRAAAAAATADADGGAAASSSSSESSSRRGAFIAFHGVTGVGKTRVLREAAAEAKRRGFAVLEPAAESGGGGGGNVRLWRSMFVEACRLLPEKAAVSIQAAALGKWTGTPKAGLTVYSHPTFTRLLSYLSFVPVHNRLKKITRVHLT